MCITYDRKPRALKYIVEGPVRCGRADHHDYVLPRSIICTMSVIGTFLFVAGAIILMVGTFTLPSVLLPWGAVICGIGFLFCFIAILLCMHAHCIIPIDGYKIPYQQPAAKKEIVVVKRIDSRDEERFANKRVFGASGAGGGAGDTSTVSSTHGRSGYVSGGQSQSASSHQTAQSQSVAYQSSTGGEVTHVLLPPASDKPYGTIERQKRGAQIIVQPSSDHSMSSAAHSQSQQSSTMRSVTVVDGGQGGTDTVRPAAGAQQAVYVQVQPQSPPSGQQAQRMQTHAQKVEYAQTHQTQGHRDSPVPQQDVIVVSNVQQQQSAPAGQFGGQAGFSSTGGQQQYSYSSHQETMSGGHAQTPTTPVSGFGGSVGGHHYASTAGQPAASNQQTVYYTETRKEYSTVDGGHQDGSNASAGLLVPAHFHGEATPDMRYMRRDLSNMSNVSGMSAFSRPDSLGIEPDDDFQYYPVGSAGHQQQQQQQQQQQEQSHQTQQQSYQYQYRVEQPQVQTQSQSSSVSYQQQAHSGGQYKGGRKGSLYENTLTQ